MNIAIAGTRGVPPRYGGFETFAAELGTRLVQRGHQVTVYGKKDDPHPAFGHPLPQAGEGRSELAPNSWNGINVIPLPAINHKYLETVSRTFLSAIDSLRRDFDVVLLCNAANAFTLPLFRAARIPVAVNVDGIERKRRKWNLLGQGVYAAGESLTVVFADRVVADAGVIASYYRERHGIKPVTIPYGSEFPAEEDSDVLARLGVSIRDYLLYVSRFEPENNPLEVVRAYEKLADAPPLVMVGEGLYARDLVETLHRHRSARILFPGALYGPDYRTLQRNALLYIHATEVGGTHPALIEAMASGGAVLAHDTEENREVGGDAIGYFRLHPDETLSTTISSWLQNPLEEWRGEARRRARARYGWERVTDAYETLFAELART